MLPKTSRINTVRFNEIIKSGKNIGFGPFYLKLLPNQEARFAVVVPKKIVKGAIKRHFIKRRVFNALKIYKNLFPSSDYVVFVNKEALDLSALEVSEKIKEIANKVASNL